MGAIQNFAFEEHLVRVVDHNGVPWFVGKDVCGALGINKHRDALSTLDPDERASSNTDPLGAGGAQEMTVVSEPGVYRLVFRSRKPEAERFKRWLAHEVLPAIRKTGRFEADTAAEQPLPTLDNSSVGVWRAKIDLVREARIQFGAARARMLWAQLGLPEVPDLPGAPVREASGDGPECLALILGQNLGGRSAQETMLAAIAGDNDAMTMLLDYGMRPAEHTDGFWVSNNAPEILRVFSATRWRDGSWLSAIRELPGAAPHTKVRFGFHQSRATWLPFSVLQPGASLPGAQK